MGVSTPDPWPICIIHCDLRLRLSLSLRFFGKSPPPVDAILEVDMGGGGRGGGLCAEVTEPGVMAAAGIFEIRGAGVGLASEGFILVLGETIGFIDVLAVGDGFGPIFDCGGGGAGRFFLLFAAE